MRPLCLGSTCLDGPFISGCFGALHRFVKANQATHHSVKYPRHHCPLTDDYSLALPIVLARSGVTCAVWHRFILNLLAGIEAIQVEPPRHAADAVGAEILQLEAVEMEGGLLADGDPDLGGLRREHAGGLLHALGDVHGAADGSVVDATGRADI